MDSNFFNRLADRYKSEENPLGDIFKPNFAQPAETSSTPDATLTTRGWFERWLYNHGVFGSDASKIMDYVIEKVDEQMIDAANGYRITWNRPAGEYPDAFYGTLILTQGIKRHVFDWANEHKPLAFWKPMFDDSKKG